MCIRDSRVCVWHLSSWGSGRGEGLAEAKEECEGGPNRSSVLAQRVRRSTSLNVQSRRHRTTSTGQCAYCKTCIDTLPRSLSLIHISEPTRLLSISYAVF